MDSGQLQHADGDEQEEFESLMATLDTQKAELRRRARRELWESQSETRRAQLRQRALADVAPLDPPLLPSTMPGSAKYSFGKSRHLQGKFKIQALSPRDPKYEHIPGGKQVPGVGSYDPPPVNGHRPEEAVGVSATGGWQAEQHSIFMRTLREFGGNASADFFDKASHRLGGEVVVPRAALVDHVRWLADYERQQARKHLRVTRWAEQRGPQGQVATSPEPQVQTAESRRARELHQQASAEEERWGGCRRQGRASAAQQRANGEVLDGNLRGHPEFRKAPGYSFAASRELRDTAAKRFTGLSHVRAASCLDNVGPGHFSGSEELARLLRRSPTWCLGLKLPARKADQAAPAGPGYDGCEDACMQVSRHLQATQLRKPAWTFGKEDARKMMNSNEMHVVVDKASTPKGLGPGRYRHSTSFLSHF